MSKTYLIAATAAAAITSSSMAAAMDNVGLGVNYGAFSGPTLELSYPITDNLQLRGALSGGMGLSETDTTEDITYDVEADGGIHRLALDYHPFNNGFFLSAGYAINNFALDADGRAASGETVTIGDTDYTVNQNVSLKGNLDWDNAPTLSLGWGHSPAEGLGFMIEVGAYFTGAPDVSLKGTGTVEDPNNPGQFLDVSDEIAADIRAEEKNLQDDIADYDFLPMLQAGITYRF